MLTPQDFVAKWRNVELKKRSAAQEFFIDLCRMVGHPTPAEADPKGEWYTFEMGADKQSGEKGWADVWKKGYFAWENKGNHKDLKKAYDQLLQYRESLQNPPLLVVADLGQILIHTNFTNTIKRVHRLTFDDLVTPDGLAKLRAVFYEPESFRVSQTTEHVTQEAAKEFAWLSDLLRANGADPHHAAHFLIRLLFCLFAEDIGLLPKNLFTNSVKNARRNPADFAGMLRQLFGAMAKGGWFGADRIQHFNGGLFENDNVLELDRDGLEMLERVSGLDWSSVEPAIFGTLFERSLDPSKRSQLGAHYTGKSDILLIVEPVLIAPLRRKWNEVREQALALVKRRDEEKSSRAKESQQAELRKLLTGFAYEISQVRVLDAACGSGNFLYLALKELLDLEKEVITCAGDVGVGTFFPSVSPTQLHGIEVNEYAHELAQATIWIGYIQWLHDNGFGVPSEPILKPLNAIVNMDAILSYDADGKLVEPAWPAADVIIGNPPFLGDKRMRAELGDTYVEQLRTLYNGRVPGAADLVTYWFERARQMICTGSVKRAGLIATNSIRQQGNRPVLDRIKTDGDIFMAWSDNAWYQAGAAVRVSVVGFDNGSEQHRTLNGKPVVQINSDLTASADATTAQPLKENEGLCFLGVMKGGPFDIDGIVAQKMLAAPINPNGKRNTDVVKKRLGGQDITKRASDSWIIDFNEMSEEEAAMFEAPFEYVRKHVKPLRDENRDKRMRQLWWLHGRSRPDLRKALNGLPRYIATPEVAKYRNFIFVDRDTLPDHTLHVIARDDYYFFGVLQSRTHELWSLAQGARMGVGNDPRYSSSRTFATFPFPWTPGTEPGNDPQLTAIAEAAHELVEKRDRWLNPDGATEADVKKRTLTNLYNERPTWLDLAHKKLDRTVFDVYCWPHDLSDEQILERLLMLNLERAQFNTI